MSKMSDAQKRAKMKYDQKAYKKFTMRLKPFQMNIFDNYCAEYGHSKNSFAVLAIKEKMERDSGKPFDQFLNDNQSTKEDSQIPQNQDEIQD